MSDFRTARAAGIDAARRFQAWRYIVHTLEGGYAVSCDIGLETVYRRALVVGAIDSTGRPVEAYTTESNLPKMRKTDDG